MPALRDPMESWITRKLAGEPAPESTGDPDDYGPGGSHFVAPDPIHAEAFRAALADERRAELVGDEDEGEALGEAYDPDALHSFTAAAAAVMGFTPAEGPPTGQEQFFEGLAEDGRDVLWQSWFGGLSVDDQAGALDGDPAAVESFARFVEQGPLSVMAAVADQIPGTKLVRDPLRR